MRGLAPAEVITARTQLNHSNKCWNEKVWQCAISSWWYTLILKQISAMRLSFWNLSGPLNSCWTLTCLVTFWGSRLGGFFSNQGVAPYWVGQCGRAPVKLFSWTRVLWFHILPGVVWLSEWGQEVTFSVVTPSPRKQTWKISRYGLHNSKLPLGNICLRDNHPDSSHHQPSCIPTTSLPISQAPW